MIGLKQQKNMGFTLLELIVAIGVFIVVVTISLSAFLNVHDIQLKMSAFRAASDSLNFVVEAMAREIKEGVGHACRAGSCSDDQYYDEIEFSTIDTPPKEITYKFDNTSKSIKRKVDSGSLEPFTPDNVTINNLSFTVKGFDSFPDDLQQPMVTISIEGKAGVKEKLKSKINIQTTVSLRQLDIIP